MSALGRIVKLYCKASSALKPVCFTGVLEFPIVNAVTCLMFSDNIDQPGGSEEELQQLTERLEKKLPLVTAWKSVGYDKSKVIVKSIKPRPSTNIGQFVNGKPSPMV